MFNFLLYSEAALLAKYLYIARNLTYFPRSLDVLIGIDITAKTHKAEQNRLDYYVRKYVKK